MRPLGANTSTRPDVQFDAEAPPFWEVHRGGGPCTEWQNQRMRSHQRTTLAKLQESKLVLEAAEGLAREAGRKDAAKRKQRELGALCREIDELRRKLALVNRRDP